MKPDNIRDLPMNDIGDFPGPETHIGVMFGLDPGVARRIVAAVMSWENPGRWRWFFEKCESPIERLLVLGFSLSEQYCVGGNKERGTLAVTGLLPGISDSPFCEIETQRVFVEEEQTGYFALRGEEPSDKEHPFARVDFLVTPLIGQVRAGWKVVVECDGHDFHDRTKEQAASDRIRDRKLVRCGCTIIRFTGSEIYRNPVACAEEVIQTCMTLQMQYNRSVALVSNTLQIVASSAEQELETVSVPMLEDGTSIQ